MKQLYYAIQTLWRGKHSVWIKVVSLASGLLISIILFAKVAFELDYDSFYEDAERVFLVETAWGNDETGNGTPSPYIIYPTAAAIAGHFPEAVESYTTFSDFVPSVVVHGKKKHKGAFVMADSLYCPTLGLRVLRGNALDLGTPGVIFLSQSFAREIFGGEDPMGKTLAYPLWGEEFALTVKGIFADIPENTSLRRTTGIVSFNTLSLRQNPPNLGWTGGGNYRAFVRLRQAADAEVINRKINAIIDSNYFPKEHYGKFKVSGIEVSVTPLTGYHLKNKDVVRMICILTLLGVAILLSATLNYVLISLSSLSQRAKMVGVHKCSGAATGHILGMFFCETALVVGFSLALALFVMLNFSGQIEALTQVSFGALFSFRYLWAPSLVVLFLLVAGSVLPGVAFSSVPVTQVFRRYTEDKRRWKYVLLFLQFGGASFLAGMLCVVFAQYHYIFSKDMGYDTRRVVYAYYPVERVDNAVGNLRNLPYVEAVACSEFDVMESRSPYPVNDASGNYLFSPRMNWLGRDFFSFIGLRLKAGRMPSGPGEILVNDEFVRKMGWTSGGVGEVVSGHGTVSGVLGGFYFLDTSEMPPFEIRCGEGGSCVHVRLKEPFAENARRLNAEMKQLYPQDEVTFRSYDEVMRGRFRSTRVFRDVTLLACVAVLVITLMGLMGYTNDEVCRRSKEIAIRKINGGSAADILRMLSRDVACISVPSVAIGALLAWNVGKIWQAQFDDALSVSPLLYAGVSAVMLLFIMSSVVMKSWHIANENPVRSIKNE